MKESTLQKPEDIHSKTLAVQKNFYFLLDSGVAARLYYALVAVV